MSEKRIARQKIYLDSPMAAAVTEVLRDFYHFLREPELREILTSQFEVISDHRASRTIVSMAEPKIVIAGSGMITGGRILHHLEAHISDPKTLVILPGFQAPGTRGHSLTHHASEVKFFGKYHAVRAEIVQLQLPGFRANHNLRSFPRFGQDLPWQSRLAWWGVECVSNSDSMGDMMMVCRISLPKSA